MPYISAGVAANTLTTVSTAIDSAVRVHSGEVARNTDLQFIGHVIRFPFGVALAPVAHILRPIRQVFRPNAENKNIENLIVMIKRAQDSIYSVHTGVLQFRIRYGC